jgi:hypothetical protein
MEPVRDKAECTSISGPPRETMFEPCQKLFRFRCRGVWSTRSMHGVLSAWKGQNTPSCWPASRDWSDKFTVPLTRYTAMRELR